MDTIQAFCPGARRRSMAELDRSGEAKYLPCIVDFPIKNGDFPWLCKRLPEGMYPTNHRYPMVWVT